MSPIKTSNSDAASSPLVEYSAGDHGRESEKRWWEKVLDLGEAKKQVLFSLPMIITSVSYDLILVVSVMFSGHLGEVELAASNLANSWATVTGFAFMIGLSGALETLCGQGYGAKLYGILGIYLQASCLISFFFSLIISIFWFYSEPILISLHQDPQISKSASLYMRFLIPGLFAFGFLHNTLRFLQAQGVVLPLVFCSVFSLTFHFGIAYFLVHWTSLGFVGAALAVSISLWVAALMVGVYVFFMKRFGHTWNGFSCEAFYHVVTNLKLALPSAAMVCLEDWAFELLVLLAGLMPNSEMTTSLIAMCVNTQSIAYMITYGLSAAASTRVSNELGAGNPGRAKHAMGVTLKLSLFLVLIVVWALGFGHNAWAGFFSDSPKVVEKFASLTPFLLVSITIDSIQGVLSGVARGWGWQHLAVYINLATFYCIGMPISILLGFKMKLYAQGLWMGLICGLACQTGTLLLLTRCSKWTKMELSDNSNKLDKPLLV
ncbi:protein DETOXIFICATION 18-like [Actinidia eriantha]|uniref:protein DETOXIFICATION 18-like n=1 Tax=Actinidia eriantha TaxID=165200 RepID=UPI002590AAC6|nr:protein DETOXIFICATION 18-like [Actinidia eriantha]